MKGSGKNKNQQSKSHKMALENQSLLFWNSVRASHGLSPLPLSSKLFSDDGDAVVAGAGAGAAVAAAAAAAADDDDDDDDDVDMEPRQQSQLTAVSIHQLTERAETEIKSCVEVRYDQEFPSPKEPPSGFQTGEVHRVKTDGGGQVGP
jgi:hypothetical protein